jgi:Ala-tRNA(Pro) deacylase
VTGDRVPACEAAGPDVYDRLIADLDASGARYRLIEHAPEGRTEVVSALRGHALASAAKCLILLVKIGKRQTRYVLAVVPGDARLDLAAVKALLGASYVAFADTGQAEQLADSVTGTVLPFSHDERLELIASRPHHRHLTTPAWSRLAEPAEHLVESFLDRLRAGAQVKDAADAT